MKRAIELFSDLGNRLSNFGNDPHSQQVMERACACNAWFSPDEIRRAVGALVNEMLRSDKLAAWLDRYPELPAHTPRRILVIMAGNIPLVSFFDLLCTLAAGHSCLVKPATKDAVLMEYVLDLLHEIGPSVPVDIYDGSSPIEAVIATGSNNAVRYFQSHYANIPTLLRGSRQSVAVLAGDETPEQLRGLADDIWAYSGLGCRNVSLVFVPEGYKLQLGVANTNHKYRNNYIQQRALLTMQQKPFADLGGAVLIEQRDFPNALSCIACSNYRSLEEVSEWLDAHDSELQCVVSQCVNHSRRVGFGRAQSPSLTDYPDDMDVMEWLSKI